MSDENKDNTEAQQFENLEKAGIAVVKTQGSKLFASGAFWKLVAAIVFGGSLSAGTSWMTRLAPATPEVTPPVTQDVAASATDRKSWHDAIEVISTRFDSHEKAQGKELEAIVKSINDIGNKMEGRFDALNTRIDNVLNRRSEVGKSASLVSESKMDSPTVTP